MFDSLTEEIKSDFCASFSTWHRSEKGTFSEISCPHGSQIIKTIFFFYFEELGGPAAKNPIRACALILLSDQNINSQLLLCHGGRAHKSFAECKCQPSILHRNFS